LEFKGFVALALRAARRKRPRAAVLPSRDLILPTCRRAASDERPPTKKMGTFPISPRSGQKGTYLRQVRPLLLGNGECPHFLR
jgi:hypothetical protein